MQFVSKLVLWIVIVAFSITTIVNPSTVRADVAFLPAPGTMVSLSPAFAPPIVRGIKVYEDNPFKFDFIVDVGDSKYTATDPAFKDESKKLIAYFLASLTTPEKDMWVNLSPYEKERIIPETFGQTTMGNELLAQDYLLKQVTASLMYPEGDVGREFWKKIYTESLKRFGSLNIMVNTLNKVWIVPDRSVVFENPKDNSVVVVESRLKIMLEEDYLALTRQKVDVTEANRQLSNDIIREVIIPALEKEVNEGRNFAALRQVYNSLILATWFKNNLKKSLLSKGYVDQNKINGVTVDNKNVNQEIYEQYLKSYRKGVYNYIKEEVNPINNAVTPKKYFSGGFTVLGLKDSIANQAMRGTDAAQLASNSLKRNIVLLTFGLAASFAAGSNIATPESANLPTVQPQASVTSATLENAVANAVQVINVKSGDTASFLLSKSQAILELEKIANKKFNFADFQFLAKSKIISLYDKNGVKKDNVNWDLIHPDEKIHVDVTAIAGFKAIPNSTVENSAPSVKASVVKKGIFATTLAKSIINGTSLNIEPPVLSPENGTSINLKPPVSPNSISNIEMSTTAIAGAAPPPPKKKSDLRVANDTSFEQPIDLKSLNETELQQALLTRYKAYLQNPPNYSQQEVARLNHEMQKAHTSYPNDKLVRVKQITELEAQIIKLKPTYVGAAQQEQRVQAIERWIKNKDDLFVNPNGPIAILSSSSSANLFTPVQTFSNANNFFEAVKSASELTVYVNKKPITDPLQWANAKEDTDTFHPLTVIEAEQFDYSAKPIIVWFKGKINGEFKEGWLMTNEKMAKETLNIVQNRGDARNSSINYRSVLAIQDGIVARKQARQEFPNAIIPEGNDVLVGVVVDSKNKPTRFVRRSEWKNVEDKTEGVLKAIRIGDQWLAMKYQPTSDLESMTFKFLDGDTTYKVVLGRNYVVRERAEALADRFLAEVENTDKIKYQAYMQDKKKFNKVMFLISAGLSFGMPGLNVPIANLINIGWDLYNRPDLIDEPSEVQMLNFLGEFIYHQSGSLVLWESLTESQKESYRHQARGMVNGDILQEQMIQLKQYVKDRYGVNHTSRFLGDVLQITTLVSDKVLSKSVGSVIRNLPINPVTGDLSVNNVLSTVLNNGRPQEFVALGNLVKPSAAEVIRSLLPGVTVNLPQLFNKLEQEYQSGNPLRAPFSHGSGPVFSINFYGLYDTKFNMQLDAVTTINKANEEGSHVAAYAFENGWFGGKVITYTQDEVNAQQLKGFVIGMTENRPVYAIVERDSQGRVSYRLLFMTRSGLLKNVEDKQRDLSNYDQVSRLAKDGGVQVYQSALGGALYDQRISTGALQSFDFTHAEESNRRAYTFDNGAALIVFANSSDWDRVHASEKYLRSLYSAQKTGFQGFYQYYDAYDLRSAVGDGVAGVGPNAEVLLALLTVRHQRQAAGLDFYARNDDMIKSLAQWIQNNWQREQGVEPVALSFGAINQYMQIMDVEHPSYNPMFQYLYDHFDQEKGLFFSATKIRSGTSFYSSDANTRAFLALGIKRFMQITGYDLEGVMQWFKNVDREFAVSDQMEVDGRYIKVRGLSLDDAKSRTRGVGNAVMFEVTAEAVQVANEIAKFAKENSNELVESQAKSMGKAYLDALQLAANMNGDLPQASQTNVPMVDYKTAEGKRALAPRVQLTMSQHGMNPFNIGVFDSVPSIKPIPTQVITDEMTRVAMYIGDKAVDEYRLKIQNEGGKYIIASGNTEAVIENRAAGIGNYINLKRPLVFEKQLKVNATVGVQNAEAIGQAYRGDKGYEKGAAIVSEIQTMPWGTVAGKIIPSVNGNMIRDTNWIKKVFDPVFDELTDEQKAKAELQGYADLRMTIEGREVYVTRIFPINKEVIHVIKDPQMKKPSVVEVTKNGIILFTVNGSNVTVPIYDTKLHALVGSYIYVNPFKDSHAERLNGDLEEYVSLLQPTVAKVKTLEGRQEAKSVTYTSRLDFSRQVGYGHVTSESIQINRADGSIKKSIFSIHMLPDSIVTPGGVAKNTYSAYGVPKEVVNYFNYSNGSSMEAILNPVQGDLHYRAQRIAGRDNHTTWMTTDNVGRVSLVEQDIKEDGRESMRLTVDPRYKVATMTLPQYDPKFFDGTIAPVTFSVNPQTGRVKGVDVYKNSDDKGGVRETHNLITGITSIVQFDSRIGEDVLVETTDSLGRRVRTTLQYNLNHTNIKAVTTIDGKPVMDRDSTYKGNQWRQVAKTWVDAKYAPLENSVSLLTPYGIVMSVERIFADAVNKLSRPQYSTDGVEVGTQDFLFNPATKKWVSQFEYGQYRYAKGTVARTKLDKPHQKSSTEKLDSVTGILLEEVTPKGQFTNKFGVVMEDQPVKVIYKYDGPYALLPGHAVSDRGESRAFESIQSGSVAISKVQNAEGKTYYEGNDWRLRNRAVEKKYYFDGSGYNVVKTNVNPYTHQLKYEALPVTTATNIVDIDILLNSVSTNFVGNLPINLIPVKGSFVSERRLETFKTSIDIERSNQKVTVINLDVLSDDNKVVRTIRLGYTYNTDRLLWKEIENKRIVINWDTPNPKFLKYGIADSIDVFEINEKGEHVRPIYSIALTGYNETDGSSRMQFTHYFGPEYKQTWVENKEMAANGDLIHTKQFKKNFDGKDSVLNVYSLYASDKNVYTTLSAGQTRHNLLEGSDVLDISRRDYMYFMADSEDNRVYDNIEVVVKDVRGKKVTFVSKLNKANYLKSIESKYSDVKELPFLFPYQTSVISSPTKRNPLRESVAVVNFRSLKDQDRNQNPFVMPTQWIVDAGLDITRIESIDMYIDGKNSKPMRISKLALLGELDDRVTMRDGTDGADGRDGREVFRSELKENIADARVKMNSDGTVTISMGWDKSYSDERKAVVSTVEGDGRLTFSTFSRDEGLGKWTPLTVPYKFDQLHESALPTLTLYAGYPSLTVADKLKSINGGLQGRASNTPTEYTVPLGPYATSVAEWAPNHTGNIPERIVYNDQIIVDRTDYLDPFKSQTGNNAYMTLLRTYFPVFNPNKENEEVDKKNFDQIKHQSADSYTPVVEALQNTPFWKVRTSPGANLQKLISTPDSIFTDEQLVKNTRELTNQQTGLISAVKGSEFANVIEQGEMYSALVLTGQKDAIEMVENVLLKRTKEKPFSFYDMTHGGKLLVTDSLMLDTGAPYLHRDELGNPLMATPSGQAQTAIANASYLLWKANQNTKARELTVELVKGLMLKYFHEDDGAGAFSELTYQDSERFLGIDFQGKPTNYYPTTNSKIYLLLSALEDDLSLPEDFRKEVKIKKVLLEKFFDRYFMEQVNDESIVPYGIYRRQNGNVEFGKIPASSADTWLYFIEAAKKMKRIDDKKAKDLMDMFARVHQVEMAGQTGFKETNNPGDRMIKPIIAINAKRVAGLIGYTQAEQSLQSIINAYPLTSEGLLSQRIGSGKLQSSLATEFSLNMAKRGSSSVYDATFVAKEQELKTELLEVRSLKNSLTALGILLGTLFLPFINRFTDLLTKSISFIQNRIFVSKSKSKIKDFDQKYVKETFNLMSALLEKQVEGVSNKRIRIIKATEGRTLDIMSAQGFSALISFYKYIQEKHPDLVSNEQLENIIKIWAEKYANEFKKQNYWWTLEKVMASESSEKKLEREKAEAQKTNEQKEQEAAERAWYKNPRNHPSTLMNEYFWNEAEKLRTVIANKGNIEDVVQETMLHLEDVSKFEPWAKLKAKEVRHPFILALARNLPLVYGMIVTASFASSEMPHLQYLTNGIIHSPWLETLNSMGGYNLILGGALILLAYFIPGKSRWFEAVRGISVIGGITLMGTWLLGLVGDYKINFLWPDSTAVATGSNLITNTFTQQLSQHPTLFTLGMGGLALSFLINLIPKIKKISPEIKSLRHWRRALGGIGVGVMAYVLQSGLHVYDVATGLVMYSTILILALESVTRFISSHSFFGTVMKYYFSSQDHFEGVRSFTMNFLVKSVYFTTGIITTISILPVMQLLLSVGDTTSWLQLMGGYVQMVIGYILGHGSIQTLLFTGIGAVAYTLPKYLHNHFGWTHFGLFSSKSVVEVGEIPKSVIKAIAYEPVIPDPKKGDPIDLWRDLLQSYPEEITKDVYNYLKIHLGVSDIKTEWLKDVSPGGWVDSRLKELAAYENDPMNLCPDTGLPIIRVMRPEDITEDKEGKYKLLRAAYYLRLFISLRTGLNGSTQELYISLLSMAKQWGKKGKNAQLIIASNNMDVLIKAENGVEKATDELKLLERISILWDKYTDRGDEEYLSQIIVNKTPSANKSGSEANTIPYIDPEHQAELVIDRQVVTNWGKEVLKVLSEFGANTNVPGSDYLVNMPSVRAPAATSEEQGAAVKMQEVTERSFGHSVVGAESATQNVGGAYGWLGFQAVDFVVSMVDYFKEGRKDPPVSMYQQDLISEDIARFFALFINSFMRQLKATSGVAEIEGEKIREVNLIQHWGSWVRWAGGWGQLMWNLTMQKMFILGHVPLSNREYRLGVAGIFALAPLAILYMTTIPLGIILGSTFFIGINSIFYLWGLLQGQASILGSLFANIESKGVFSGIGGWIANIPRNIMLIGGSQIVINASGFLLSITKGVSPVFNLMREASKGAESALQHLQYLGGELVKSTKMSAKWKWTPGAKFYQTYGIHLTIGLLGISSYLFAISRLDLLNLMLLSLMYVQVSSFFMEIFLYHEKIGEKTKFVFPAKLAAVVGTTMSIVAYVIGVNEMNYGWLQPIAVLSFGVLGVGTVIGHSYLREKAKTSSVINKTRRVLSEMSRASWLTLVIQLPVILVKTAGVVYAEIGSRVGTLPFLDLSVGFGLHVVLPAIVFVAIAKILDPILSKIGHKNHEKMIKALKEIPQEFTEEAENLIESHRKNINNEYWLSAKKPKREFYKLLKSNPNSMPNTFINNIRTALRFPKASSDQAQLAKGGIDLGLVNVEVQNKNSISTAFDDPAMLQLIVRADGLLPVIYSIKPMSQPMIQSFVGSIN